MGKHNTCIIFSKWMRHIYSISIWKHFLLHIIALLFIWRQNTRLPYMCKWVHFAYHWIRNGVWTWWISDHFFSLSRYYIGLYIACM